MTHAALYVRQSEDVQEGIERQTALTTALAEARGYSWAVYEDNHTSAHSYRGVKTAWARMLRDIEAGRVDVVISVNLDRLVRGQKELLMLLELRVPIVTADGDLDLTTADGELAASMRTSMARFEVRKKGEKQMRANQYRRDNGRPTPGRRLYGYETDKRSPRESEAVIVRKAFLDFRAGASINAITAGLVATGAPGTGVEWTRRRVRDMLNNPTYAGMIVHKGHAIPSEVVRPIVDPELSAEVRAMLADPTRRTNPGTAPRHLMSGIAVCGVCGADMYFMRDYRCKENSAHPCIKKELLDRAVLSEVVSAFQYGGDDMFAAYTGGLDRNAISAAITALEGRQQEQMDLRRDELISAAQLRAELTALKVEREALEVQLANIRATSASASILLDLRTEVMRPGRVDWDAVIEVRDQIPVSFEALDIQHRKEIVRGLLDVVVNPGRGAGRVAIHHKVVTQLNEDAAA